jgi:hypothetical protein
MARRSLVLGSIVLGVVLVVGLAVTTSGVTEAKSLIPINYSSGASLSGRVSGPDPVGTRYHISSVTYGNATASPTTQLLIAHSAPDGCAGSTSGSFIILEVTIPAFSTVSMPFPQPFVTPVLGPDVTCLDATVPTGIQATIVGARE